MLVGKNDVEQDRKELRLSVSSSRHHSALHLLAISFWSGALVQGANWLVARSQGCWLREALVFLIFLAGL